MRITTLSLLLAVAAFLPRAHAADWGKVTWGMSRAEVTAQYPAAVPAGEGLAAPQAVEILKLPFDAAFEFRDDKLIGVGLRSVVSSVDLPRGSTSGFRDLLCGKYGHPLVLNGGASAPEGLWRTDRTLVKVFCPATPSADLPAITLHYLSLSAPNFDNL